MLFEWLSQLYVCVISLSHLYSCVLLCVCVCVFVCVCACRAFGAEKHFMRRQTEAFCFLFRNTTAAVLAVQTSRKKSSHHKLWRRISVSALVDMSASYLMFNFPKLCCSFYESPATSPSSISPTFALSFSLSPIAHIVLEEGMTFRQGEENTLPTNIGTEANKSRERRERRDRRAQGESGWVLHWKKSSKE